MARRFQRRSLERAIFSLFTDLSHRQSIADQCAMCVAQSDRFTDVRQATGRDETLRCARAYGRVMSARTVRATNRASGDTSVGRSAGHRTVRHRSRFYSAGKRSALFGRYGPRLARLPCAAINLPGLVAAAFGSAPAATKAARLHSRNFFASMSSNMVLR
jgi:hypothetical protein